MVQRIMLVSEEEAAFRQWLVDVETPVLECRAGRHLIPGITDERVKTNARQGRVVIDAYCVRETADGATCGTFIRKYLGATGILEGAYVKYDHDVDYKLPPGVGQGDNGRLSKEQLGRCRLELIKRKKHVAAAKERKARKDRAAARQVSGSR